MPRYRIVPTARRDLESILDYVSEESVDGALRLADRFGEIFEVLADHPDSGRRRPDLTTADVRFFPVQTYLVIYRPSPAPITILRVLSAYRDIVRLLEID